ncbi:ATP-binding protein [Planococcus chinensis]|uniref:ATP-binding protein n=1 Tax=Planococcus chinensis TaxID=272917 RepID=A0ABW4QD42_9BACL
MQEYVKELTKIVNGKNSEVQNASFFRIDHISNPAIYLELANSLKKNNDQIIIKLSQEKYEEFIRENKFGEILHHLKEKNFISDSQRLTKWRNAFAEEKKTIILLGTESVQDKGGLADFYSITPKDIEKSLNGNYAKWFDGIIDIENKAQADLVNSMFEVIFKLTPIDLLQVSEIVEDVKVEGITEASELLQFVLRNLWSYFELPNIKTVEAKAISKMANTKKLPLLESAAKFIRREEYKDGFSPSKEKKLIQKFEKFATTEDFEFYKHDIEEKFNSYENLRKKALNFAKGINVQQLREEMGKFDFFILNKILGVKTKEPGGDPAPLKVRAIKGNPLHAFSMMVIDYIQEAKKEEEIVEGSKLIIDVQQISLAEGTVSEDQVNRWKELCIAVKGINEYLNDELNNLVNIEYLNQEDIFDFNNFNNPVIGFASTQVKVSKIYFHLQIEGFEALEYMWSFSPYDYWLQSFSYLSILEEQLEGNDMLLPVFSSDNLGNLLSSTDTTSFHFQIKEHEILANDILTILKHLQPIEGILFGKLLRLREPFVNFLHYIKQEGFYKSINTNYSNAAAIFVNKYIEVMKEIYENIGQMKQVEKDSLYLVSNLFCIVAKEDVSATVGKIEGAIIPPFHPAMLEKIIDQQAYQRKGMAEAVKESLTADAMPSTKLKAKFEKLERQSTIISGVDTILSADSLSRIPSHVLGYFAIHGSHSKTTILDSSSLLDVNLSGGEESNEDDTASNSAKAKLIQSHIHQYINTFPANIDSLSIGFVNFDQLQPVIEGLHEFIGNYKNSPHGVNLRLDILSSKTNYKAKNYMSMWLDSVFTEDDNITIQTYFNKFDPRNMNSIEEIIDGTQYDLLFIENLMVTKEIKYEKTGEQTIKPGDTRFPMVFHPMPVRNDETIRNVSISQKQFQASFAHSQLIFWIEHPFSEKQLYRVEKVLGLEASIKDMLQRLHKNSQWVISLDTGLDKSIFEKEHIISFATGEGAFGELNVAISASANMKKDIALRLKNRLKALFTSWNVNMCEESAKYILDSSSALDGIKVLKALNPRDYEIHSFLSGILAVKTLDIDSPKNQTILKSFISLDSYSHWFSNEPNRPDYLLLEIEKDGLNEEKLIIKANLVECKMGKENQVHIDKGTLQLKNSLKFLGKVFNGESTANDRRYWYAQLYRLLAFSPVHITDDQITKGALNRNLLKILDGEFKIIWDATLLTYWLDHNQEEVSNAEILLEDSNVKINHKAYGQLYIQSQLLPQKERQEIEFIAPITKEFDAFADDKENYEEIIKNLDDNDLFLKEYEVIDVKTPQLVPGNTTTEVGKDFYKSVAEKINQNSSQAAENQKEMKKDDDSLIDDSKEQQKPEAVIEEIEEPEEPGQSLESIRVLLGEDSRTKKKIYWEYGHPKLENRHILISGKSGVGKTYFMQCLLLELANNNISSLIFDYTDGFKKSKLEPEFKDSLGDRINQFHVQKEGFPVNPFKKNLKEIDEDEFMEETDIDVAERIRSVFSAVYPGMGDQQANAIYRATYNGLKKYGDKMSLQYLKVELENDNSANAKTVLSKIEPLIDRNPFNMEKEYDWEEHRTKDGIVFVVQLSGFVREVQLIVTEFILWDLWNFNLSHGDKSKPFPVILDEAQNLDHSEKSPSAKILTEGRKFGWSGWYATQFMQGQMAKDEIRRLQNAGQKVYFSPPESEINDMASFLSTDASERKEWANKLSKIGKGQCIVSGPMLKENGELQYGRPAIIDVTPLKERV